MNSRFAALRLSALLVLVLLCSSCSAPPKIHFDDSHQRFLEKAVSDLSLVEDISTVITKDRSVCFVSMEDEETVDAPLVAMVEDIMLNQLVTAGYSVLERDDDLIRRLIREGSDEHFQYTLFPQPVVMSQASASLYTSPWTYGGRGSVGTTVIEGAEQDSLLVIPTRMQAADCIIAYRILECGLVYRKSDNRMMKKREAQIRLHVRVHDARTGEILLARNIESRAEDEIDANIARYLSAYHYRFFRPDYPRQPGGVWGYREVEGTGKTKTVDGSVAADNPQ